MRGRMRGRMRGKMLLPLKSHLFMEIIIAGVFNLMLFHLSGVTILWRINYNQKSIFLRFFIIYVRWRLHYPLNSCFIIFPHSIHIFARICELLRSYRMFFCWKTCRQTWPYSFSKKIIKNSRSEEDTKRKSHSRYSSRSPLTSDTHVHPQILNSNNIFYKQRHPSANVFV